MKKRWQWKDPDYFQGPPDSDDDGCLMWLAIAFLVLVAFACCNFL